MRVLSLGAGVQSTTMALMAARGEIGPMPDCAIFADTQDEPEAVYKHLLWLQSGVLPFPIHTVTNGRLSERLFAGDDEARIPFYFESGGLPNRQCTRNYKIRPIRRFVRDLLGDTKLLPGLVEMWIGISTDEASRMKPSDVQYISHRWPLIELLKSRQDCLKWLEIHGYAKPPRSACVYCPYKQDYEWRDLRKNQKDWDLAVSVDEKVRSPEMVARLGGAMFAHRSKVPLRDADLSTLEDHGQLNFFNEECEGMCGV